MRHLYNFLTCSTLALALVTTPMMAQTDQTAAEKVPVIFAPHTQSVSYGERTLCYKISANVDFTVTTDADWVTVRKTDDGTVYVHVTTNTNNEERVAVVTFANEENKLSEKLTITQSKDNSIENTPTDLIYNIPVSAQANTYQNGENIDKSYDRNQSTLWHSAYNGFTVSSANPAILTYNFSGVERIDYINYVPRTSGDNGKWGKVELWIQYGDKTSLQKIQTVDLKYNGDNYQFVLDKSIVNPTKVQFKILSGSGNFASCAEVEFVTVNKNNLLETLFTDNTMSALKNGVTLKQISEVDDDFLRNYATRLFNKTYDFDYRLAEYSAKLSYYTQSDLWNAPGKYYDQFQGTTGINITKGTQAVAVDGLPDNGFVTMKVVAWYIGKDGGNFDGGNPKEFSYKLHNGLNLINYDFDYDGLAYICYYADSQPELQPKLKVHFIDGQVNGYLSQDKTNEQMHELTANAKNICMDVVGHKVHSVWTAKGLHDYCKATDGTSIGYLQYMNVLDSLVTWEHDLLGFTKYNMLPDNRTFAYANWTYYMFQGGYGVSFHHNQESRVLNCKTLTVGDDDAIWGLSHEWGHQHQMHPYFCWAGMSEVTNNMNSYYNIMKMGYHSSEKINNFIPAVKHFVDKDISDLYVKDEKGNNLPLYSNMRHLAYVNRNLMANTALRAKCEEMKDSLIYYPNNANKTKTLAISEVGVGETLCPFVKLYNYFYSKGMRDFAPDWYEALRQTDNENGSTIEKTDGIDKYELIAAAQNNNKNGKLTKLMAAYPNSVWVKNGYVNASSSQWENSMPYVLNYIRKVSRLSGYNLFPYFERWGFLRQVALYIGDYGNKWLIFNKDMYDEFKEDMDALGLKECDDQMVDEISNTADLFDIPNSGFGTTPSFPNENK